MTIFDWLLQNAIVYEQHSPIDFTIPSVGHFLVISEKDKVFNESFDLELDDQEREVDIDFYCYKFGNQWHYTPKDSIERVTLLPMRYLGKAQLDLDVPCGCLGVHGGFDLLNGSRDYGDWCRKAKFLGIDVLGITEKNTLGGVLKFQLSCTKNNIHPIIGMQIVVRQNGEFLQLKCYVKNGIGWTNLLLINKEINVINEGFIEQNRLLELLEGLVLVIDPKFTTHKQCLPFSLQIPNLYWQLDTVIFNNEEKDKQYLLNVKEFLSDREMEPVLICDAFYLDKDQDGVKVILNNIADKRDFASSNQYFKSLDEIYQELILLFNDDERMFQLIEKSLENLQVIIQSCNFTVSTEGKHLPAYIMNSDQATNFTSNKELFYYLLEVGVEKRLNKVEDIDVYLDRLETECRVIELGGFIDYFLILWDIVQFAKTNGILTGIGRGSGGGSLIAYLLELTHLDPLRYGLLFERFLNEGRIGKSLPDLDTDFPGERREEIKRYMEQKYGKEQVCSVGTYTTLKVKAALKDLGRQHNISIPTLNYINKILPDDSTFTDLFHIASEKSIVKNFIIENPEIIEYLPFILNQPKSKSIHACAMLILPDEKNIFEWIPVRTELKDGEKMLVSEWEGPELEAIGLLKEDILGIEQLDKFSKILELIKQNHNIDLDIYTLPLDDELVYDYFCHGYNGDVFHFGSKGLTSYCKDLQPTCIDDLIAGIALYRPGAMESNIHNEYVLRKRGDREVEYIQGTEDITRETYGNLIYQEQVMRVCQEIGGFTLIEADDIRKGIGKKIQSLIDSYRVKFIQGGVSKGYDNESLENTWDILKKFAEYSFNKSHAAAYAITGYICQWLKVHYPMEFWVVALSRADEKEIPRYMAEINNLRTRVKIKSPDINHSGIGFMVNKEREEILWSIDRVKQCGEEAVKAILEDRMKDGEYFSLDEFISRLPKNKVKKNVIENLILCGLFDQVEGIKNITERLSILKKFYTLRSVKLEDDDFININKDKLRHEWFWILVQKNLSGYGYFDYKKIGRSITTIKDPLIDSEIVHSILEPSQRIRGAFVGVVQEVVIKNSKKGEFAQVLLDHNYENVWVIFWSEIWEDFKDRIIGSEGKILIVTGSLFYDDWRKENVVQTEDFTEIEILS